MSGATSSLGVLNLNPVLTNPDPPQTGDVFFDEASQSIHYVPADGSTITLPIGFTQLARVHNNSGATLACGDVVYETTSSDPTTQTVRVAKAQANAVPTSVPLGVVAGGAAIANGETGFVCASGLVQNVNTAAWAAGSVLYVSSTVAGELVTSQPSTATQFPWRVGTVITSHISSGIISVRCTPVTHVTSVAGQSGAVVLQMSHISNAGSAATLGAGTASGQVPVVGGAGLTVSQVVVTDGGGALATEAKGTAFNKSLGTTAGTVAVGNILTSASVTAGTGLSGGGALPACTLNLGIDSLPADATVDTAADYVAVYRSGSVEHRKVLLGNLGGAGGVGAMPAVMAARTTDYSITASYADVTMNSTVVENDTGILEHNSTFTQRLDVKAAGLYLLLFGCNVDFASQFSDVTHLEARILKNGGTVVPSSYARSANYTYEEMEITKAIVASFATNDYITLQLRWSGGTPNTFDAEDSYMGLVRLTGATGATGETGAAGTNGANGDITWHQAWTSQNYVANQAVSYNGSSYVCHTNTVASAVPTNTSYWNVLATGYPPTGGGATRQIENASLEASTNSSSFEDVPDMSITVSNTGTADYLVLFHASLQTTSKERNAHVILNVGGAAIASTERSLFTSKKNKTFPISTQHLAKGVPDGTDILVQYKTDTTMKLFLRCLVVIEMI